jgi:hypothetical protein
MFVLCVYPMRDPDFWWHLKTGQLIVERAAVPDSDWYTIMDANRPWIDLHWGFQLLIASVYGLGGSTAVILFKAAAYTAATAVGWFAAGRNLPVAWKAAVWILPAVTISGRAVERPEMLSLLALAAWMWVLERVDSRPRLAWMLPPLQCVWANCHALFILGVVVGAAYVADRLVRHWRPGRWGMDLPPEGTPRTVVWAGVLTLLACFLTPYGADGAAFPYVLYRKFTVDQSIYSSIGEFQQPIAFFRQYGFKSLYLNAEMALWIAVAASLVWLAILRRFSPYRWLVFLAFSHLAWEASRNTSVFSVVCGVLLASNVRDILHSRRDSPGTAPRPASRFAPWLPAAALTGFSGLILAVVTGLWDRWGGEDKPFALGEANAWFAHDACRFAAQPGFPDWAFVSHLGQAGVYVYHNAPARRVFTDARLEVSSQNTFLLYTQLLQLLASGRAAEFEVFFANQDRGLPVVILDSRNSRSEINGLLLSGRWRLVFADAAAAVFLDNAAADRLHLPSADPTPLIQPPGTRIRPFQP